MIHLIQWVLGLAYTAGILWVIYKVGSSLAQRDLDRAKSPKYRKAAKKRRQRYDAGDEFWW